MAWIFLFWFFMFTNSVLLICSSFYQLLCLIDLESDYLNPFEVSYRTNSLVESEFLLQGWCCILLFVTGHWFMFGLAIPVACYHVNLYMKGEHLIDVTEICKKLKVEKRIRLVKLGVYKFFFVSVVFNLTLAGFEALAVPNETPPSSYPGC